MEEPRQGGWPFFNNLGEPQRKCLQQILGTLGMDLNGDVLNFLFDRNSYFERYLSSLSECRHLNEFEREVVLNRLRWDNTLMRSRITIRGYTAGKSGEKGIYQQTRAEGGNIEIFGETTQDVNPLSPMLFNATHADGKSWSNTLLFRKEEPIKEEEPKITLIGPTKLNLFTSTEHRIVNSTNAIFIGSRFKLPGTTLTFIQQNDEIDKDRFYYWVIIGPDLRLIIRVVYEAEPATDYEFVVNGLIDSKKGDMVLLLDQLPSPPLTNESEEDDRV